MQKGTLLHERSLLHKDAFARRYFSTDVFFKLIYFFFSFN